MSKKASRSYLVHWQSKGHAYYKISSGYRLWVAMACKTTMVISYTSGHSQRFHGNGLTIGWNSIERSARSLCNLVGLYADTRSEVWLSLHILCICGLFWKWDSHSGLCPPFMWFTRYYWSWDWVRCEVPKTCTEKLNIPQETQCARTLVSWRGCFAEWLTTHKNSRGILICYSTTQITYLPGNLATHWWVVP